MRGVTVVGDPRARFFKFLLTRLMRGVTHADHQTVKSGIHFYSHASCEA